MHVSAFGPTNILLVTLPDGWAALYPLLADTALIGKDQISSRCTLVLALSSELPVLCWSVCCFVFGPGRALWHLHWSFGKYCFTD